MSTVVCKVFSFFIYTMLDFSVLIIVILTGTKLYAISYPIKANASHFNRTKSAIILLSALLACFTVNSHFLLTLQMVEVQDHNKSINNSQINFPDFINCTMECKTAKWNVFYDYYWVYIDATIYSFLPFSLISIFNTLIDRRLVREKKDSLKLQQYELPVINKNRTASNYSANNNQLESRMPATVIFYGNQWVNVLEHNCTEAVRPSGFQKTSNIERFYSESSKGFEDPISINKKLSIQIQSKRKSNAKEANLYLKLVFFIISICFCVFTMPIVILKIFNQVNVNKNNQNNFHNSNTFELLRAIFEILKYLNHGLSFFLYCISGKTYRDETKALFNYYI